MIHTLAWLGIGMSFVGLLFTLRLTRAAITEKDVSFTVGFGCCAALCVAALAAFTNIIGGK